MIWMIYQHSYDMRLLQSMLRNTLKSCLKITTLQIKKEIIIWGLVPPYNFMYINYTAYAAEESATVMRTSRKYN